MKSFLISCTNPTCAIDEAHKGLFQGHEDLLESSAGWEPGALNLAQAISMKLSVPLIYGDVSRLLINLEQEGDSRWSEISSKLPETTRHHLITRYEEKYRNAIQSQLARSFKRYRPILHFLVHTMPAQEGEIQFEFTGNPLAEDIATNTLKNLSLSEVNVFKRPMENQTPFVHWLLSTYPSENYGLLKINVSQSFFLQSRPIRWETLKKSLIQALSLACE